MGRFAEVAKPYVVGFVAGIVVTLVVAFSTGWVVTAGTMRETVKTARVEQLASLCASEAKETWTAQNKELDALKGWDNREERARLVKTVLADFQLPKQLSASVEDECGDILS